MRVRHNHSSAKARRKRLAKASKRRKAERKEQRSRDNYMTGKYGERAHNMCGKKIRYSTEDEALSRAIRSTFYGKETLRVYRCPYCHGWHLTSKERL